MDFTNRSNQQSQAVHPGTPVNFTPTPDAGKLDRKRGGKRDLFNEKWTRIASVVLLLVVAVLIAAVAGLIYNAKPDSEQKYVNKDKLQAVFLNTGQVYFGNIKTMNPDYVVVGNIYYLQSSDKSTDKAAATDANVSLVKLGCELHEPYDQMVINRSQVTFWENLQDDGQVAKAVAQFKQQHPKGQSCSDQSQAPNTQSNVQNQSNAGTGSNTNTPATNTPATNKP